MGAVDEQVRLEYDRAVGLFRDLTDIRFKLLALVPTLSARPAGLLRVGSSVPIRAAASSLISLLRSS